MTPRAERADLLKFIAARSEKGRAITVKDLASVFVLSGEAAGARLITLWRHRLIRTDTDRRARYRFRLLPGEKVSDLRFRLGARGRQWLRWYDRQNKDGGEGLFG